VALTIDITKWQDNVIALHDQYFRGKPFPHIVLDNFFDFVVADQIREDFPTDVENKGWFHWQHFNQNKHGLNIPNFLPGSIRDVIDYLNANDFISFLEKLAGIENLISDRTLEGAGLHVSKRNGYLNVHADFTVHYRLESLHRRLNVILYLNRDWLPEYNGDLELWSKDMKRCEKSIAPVFNRLVVFNTNHQSYHGFPVPLLCPPNETRKSLLLYYYTKAENVNNVVSTDYQSRPGDGLKAIPIWIDNNLLAAYAFVRRKLNISDEFASKILGAGFKTRKKQ
jgi:Rps23 Pro-64 3,4-dihydroxylase Tpa1-like proline 4-hydroxylase